MGEAACDVGTSWAVDGGAAWPGFRGNSHCPKDGIRAIAAIATAASDNVVCSFRISTPVPLSPNIRFGPDQRLTYDSTLPSPLSGTTRPGPLKFLMRLSYAICGSTSTADDPGPILVPRFHLLSPASPFPGKTGMLRTGSKHSRLRRLRRPPWILGLICQAAAAQWLTQESEGSCRGFDDAVLERSTKMVQAPQECARRSSRVDDEVELDASQGESCRSRQL